MFQDHFWNVPLSQIFLKTGSSKNGLSGEEAQKRLTLFGPNDALHTHRASIWNQLIYRFTNPLIAILFFASALSLATGESRSFFIIIVIILLSIALDLFQQQQAENAIEDLKKVVGLRCTVVRDGHEIDVPVSLLVSGDVIKLSAGDVVPADCRILGSQDLYVNQAILTGESYPVEKYVCDLSAPTTELIGAVNSIFMGTSIVSGYATLLIYQTGTKTEFGMLAGALKSQKPADAFERGVRNFGMLMLKFTTFLVFFVLSVNLIFQRPFLESLLYALSLAVGLTPELLPMIVTVTLSRGAIRLAKRRVVVKRLASIHDLGAMDVLCADKTGTLTEYSIRLEKFIDTEGRESEKVLELSFLNSYFESGIKSPLDKAILSKKTFTTSHFTKIDEIPFDFERRRISVLLDDGASHLLIIKGAPEDIISLSTHIRLENEQTENLSESGRKKLLSQFDQLGSDGYRVLAVAYRHFFRNQLQALKTDEEDLTFAGFLLFIDPPKADASSAVLFLKEQGVEIKILTGDNEKITTHVCNAIGLKIKGLLTGKDLDLLSEDALRARLSQTNLFCRLSPSQKERILLALKRSGCTVGFLGDGINDASALHASDVGISVDTAADVAKEAADLVLLDHDLRVLCEGIEEGRRTVKNITKYILMGASSNLGNMFSMAGAALFLPFLPMLPPQILLNNLLYDISEFGVPFDNVDKDATHKPVKWDLKFIERFMLVLGPVSSIFDFLTFYVLLKLFGENEAMFQTGWFIESIVTQALVIFVIRTEMAPWTSRPNQILTALSLSVVALGLLIPLTPFGQIFGFVSLPRSYFVFLFLAVVGYLFITEIIKRYFYKNISISRKN
ncbi:MAG: magnesium-translocating P-type ATPase [Hyphomicrobium sp.]